MPHDLQSFAAAQLEAILGLAFEESEKGDPNAPLPEDVQAHIAAIADLTPEDMDNPEEANEDDWEEAEESSEDDDTPPVASGALSGG